MASDKIAWKGTKGSLKGSKVKKWVQTYTFYKITMPIDNKTKM